jgi:hypothetical protein
MHMIAGEARTIEGPAFQGPVDRRREAGAAGLHALPGHQLLLRALALPEAREAVVALPCPSKPTIPALGRWLPASRNHCRDMNAHSTALALTSLPDDGLRWQHRMMVDTLSA